jgi:hypothetical protein
VSLRGYIFFGSAVSILEEVKRHVLRGHMDQYQPRHSLSAASLAALNNASQQHYTQVGEDIHPPRLGMLHIRPRLVDSSHHPQSDCYIYIMRAVPTSSDTPSPRSTTPHNTNNTIHM